MSASSLILCDLVEPPARTARIGGRRRRLHPEAKHDELRRKAAQRSVELQQNGWRWPYGWLVTLKTLDGKRHTEDARSYAEAVSVRDQALESGEYEEAWVRMKIV